jgi:biotin carboxylase
MRKYIVCIASEFKGNEFLEECQNAGWHVTLVTRNDLKDAAWAWTSLNDVQTVDGYASVEGYIRTITNIAGSRPIDRIVGLDEFDVLTAARAREHLQLAGISGSYGLRFRDKLRMRNLAAGLSIPCPEFVGVFNQDEINAYLDRVPGPWIVKPRTEVSAFGIRKCETKDQVWQVLTDLDERNTWRDHPSQFLIERFITGKVYHVDSVVENGEVVAAGISEYGTPPYNVSHQGGVFSTFTVDYRSKERKALEGLNDQLLEGFEYRRGVAHAEFLRSDETGEYFLLEVACRVGGAYIANVTEYANGFNLWREWAKLETATDENPYTPPKVRKEYAGICLALAKEEHPDTSHFDDPEVVYRVHKPKHVGLIVHSKKKARLYELLGEYSDRITREFLATAPAKERYDD